VFEELDAARPPFAAALCLFMAEQSILRELQAAYARQAYWQDQRELALTSRDKVATTNASQRVEQSQWLICFIERTWDSSILRK
jgi:hypothetical protein